MIAMEHTRYDARRVRYDAMRVRQWTHKVVSKIAFEECQAAVSTRRRADSSGIQLVHTEAHMAPTGDAREQGHAAGERLATAALGVAGNALQF